MIINLADKDVTEYKKECSIPKAYAGKKVNEIVQLQFLSRGLADLLQDELLSSEDEDDAEELEEVEEEEEEADSEPEEIIE